MDNENGNAVNAAGAWKSAYPEIQKEYDDAPDGAKEYFKHIGRVTFVTADGVEGEDPDYKKVGKRELCKTLTDDDFNYLFKCGLPRNEKMGLKMLQRELRGGGNADGGDGGGGGGDVPNQNGNITPFVVAPPVEGYAPMSQGEMLGDAENAPTVSEREATDAFAKELGDVLATEVNLRSSFTVKRDKAVKNRIIIEVRPDVNQDDAEKAEAELSDVKRVVKDFLERRWRCESVAFHDYFLADGTEIIATLPYGVETMADFMRGMVYAAKRDELAKYPPSFFLETKSHYRQLRNMAAKKLLYLPDGLYDLETAEALNPPPTEGFLVCIESDESETSGAAQYLSDEVYDAAVATVSKEANAAPILSKFGKLRIAFAVSDYEKAMAIAAKYDQPNVINLEDIAPEDANADANADGNADAGGDNGGDANADANADADNGGNNGDANASSTSPTPDNIGAQTGGGNAATAQ